MTYKEVIAVDFDGTLLFNKYPSLDNPNMKLINYIKKHRDEYIWVLWTCRTDALLQEAIEYMRSFGIEFDYINENRPEAIELSNDDSRKIWANYYIDDKNTTLAGLKWTRAKGRLRKWKTILKQFFQK